MAYNAPSPRVLHLSGLWTGMHRNLCVTLPNELCQRYSGYTIEKQHSGRFTLGCQPTQGGTDQRRAGGGEERSAAECSRLGVAIYPCPPRIRTWRALTPTCTSSMAQAVRHLYHHVPGMDMGGRAGASDGPGVDQVSRESRSRARSSAREASIGTILLVVNPSFYTRSQVLSSVMQSGHW